MCKAASLKFEGVIFDMGDILYDASTWRRWLTEELRRHGVDVTYPALVEQWEHLLVDVYRGAADYWARFDELLRTVGLPAEAVGGVTQAARRMAEAVQVDRQPMEGVVETLERLQAAGVKMAVLSDSESGREKVCRSLEDLGIAGYFDAVITSADIGCVKPDREAFQAAVDALGLDISLCAFVGHDVDELEGAQQAGLCAIAYNYHPAAPADVRLDHFSQLEQVVFEEEVCT